ncbi:MAG: prepilin peptidase [Myxococcaceae bacterium]|nr:prepilin peptidase [Myxococcaceae bacterium]
MTHADALALLLLAALAVAVLFDLVRRTIPAWVSLPALGAALVVRAATEGLGGAETGVASGLLAAAAASALFALLAWRGRGKSFGWGDAGLMAAVGGALGYPLVLTALAFIALVAALQALVTVVWQGAVWDVVRGLAARWARWLRVDAGAPVPARHIPYSVAIALGTLWTMWWDRRGGG